MINENLIHDPKSVQKEVIRIILADDHAVVRQALKMFLEKQPDFIVVAEAKDGTEAVKFALELIPNVVIMDISMPVMNGLEATKQIKEKCPDIGILALTVHTERAYVMGILEAGAAGYLTKNVFGEEVIQAIRSVVAGETVLTPAILKQILQTIPQEPAKSTPLYTGDKMSVREIEILKLAAKGLSNKDIAGNLEISIRTVKGYLVGIFAKLRVGSRTEAVMAGLRIGLLDMHDIE